MNDLTVISFRDGEQLAQYWHNGKCYFIHIQNDGNYLPYELIKVAAYVSLRDCKTTAARVQRFKEVVGQGGEPAPCNVSIS